MVGTSCAKTVYIDILFFFESSQFPIMNLLLGVKRLKWPLNPFALGTKALMVGSSARKTKFGLFTSNPYWANWNLQLGIFIRKSWGNLDEFQIRSKLEIRDIRICPMHCLPMLDFTDDHLDPGFRVKRKDCQESKGLFYKFSLASSLMWLTNICCDTLVK